MASPVPPLVNQIFAPFFCEIMQLVSLFFLLDSPKKSFLMTVFVVILVILKWPICVYTSSSLQNKGFAVLIKNAELLMGMQSNHKSKSVLGISQLYID